MVDARAFEMEGMPSESIAETDGESTLNVELKSTFGAGVDAFLRVPGRGVMISSVWSIVRLSGVVVSVVTGSVWAVDRVDTDG